jgi:hypothetical protein
MSGLPAPFKRLAIAASMVLYMVASNLVLLCSRGIHDGSRSNKWLKDGHPRLFALNQRTSLIIQNKRMVDHLIHVLVLNSGFHNVTAGTWNAR